MTAPTPVTMRLNFLKVQEGFVYRPPNPWIFGKSQHYLVSEAQRNEIEALLQPTWPPAIQLLVIIIVLAAAATAFVLVGMREPFKTFATDYPSTNLVAVTCLMAASAFAMLHLLLRRQLARVQPVLSRATPSTRSISLEDIQASSDVPVNRTLYLGAGMCLVSVVMAIAGVVLSWRGVDVARPFILNAGIVGIAGTAQLSAWARRTTQPKLAATLARLTTGLLLAIFVAGGALAFTAIQSDFSDLAQAKRLMARGDHAGVVASLTKVIDADPTNRIAYSDRAKSQAALGKNDAAIEDYTKAITIKPTFFDLVFRAILHHKKKDYDLVIADSTRAIELGSPSDTAYVMRAIAHEAKKDGTLAIADYTKAIEVDATNISSFSSRAALYMASGQKERALEDYRRILELPGSGPRTEKARDNARNAIANLTVPVK